MEPTDPAGTLLLFWAASARGTAAGPERGGDRSVGPAASRAARRAERALDEVGKVLPRLDQLVAVMAPNMGAILGKRIKRRTA